ncbi:CLIP-associating protein 1-A isoform X1 [Schistocerca gregaria]|uniref:CLIP-associating protein 1-A isoform X1 n=1 Tax=Schistocerca gregaria TaxID=7010 RepID=UPI00211F0371|nr:CLIP-associating protein 1-A isoform X1 [Schistocerca gregaria]XP_049844468.1 CLIP-associating protein 1-A isoform X1 [Schistocerca gregaria]XP_049844469.1 CLIP-associating protein 1-A isoform X1 [Schistocerca gregaria]XP_049844470.1 CLIP-associating protein 1-A isoform X1 [Schistocerca gregaria]XP_049844471.1 CLIP-associating protein 1-A isoform X1 [Schistocerca gregaria]
MAAPKSLDDFNKLLDTSDTKVKLTVTNNLLAYLSNPENSLECEDIGLFMDAMVPWMQSPNSKLSQNSIDVLTNFADRMGTDFKPYLQMVISPVVDRLGDNKEVVREKAQLFLLKLLEREIASPYYLFEKLTLAFTHKNAKIREEVLICYQSALREHGPSNLGLSKHVPSILKLLHDPLPSVRDAAFNTMTEIYRHVGEKFRQDIQRRCSAKDTKIATLFSKFDEIKNEGGLLASACGAEDSARSFDEPDGDAGAIPKSGRQRSASFSKKNSGVGKATSPAPGSKTRRSASFKRQLVTASAVPGNQGSKKASAGAVDEEHFVKVFEEVQPATIFTVRELEEELTKITDIINDPNNDWSKRVEALKKLRSVVMAGAVKHEEFFKHLRLMETPFLGVLKDLRSQVVREACCTIAFMSQQLGSKFDHFAEIILGNLINLIPNSAKVIATAGLVTVRFLIRYTHSHRLIPAIISNMESKSREIRRACCEFLELIIRLWPAHTLEKQVSNLQQALRKGMYDADSEARQCSRRAFWHFRVHFHENAEQILNSLDSTHKKALNLEMGMLNSNNVVDQQGGRGGRLAAGSDFPRGRTVADGSPRRGSAPGPSALRSNSAIDLQAAQRAKARAQYAALARHKVGSGASLPRPGKKAADSSGMSTSVITSPERLGRTRSRMSNVSQSQPTSRSGSPSSRLSYATFSNTNRETGHDGRQRRPSGIPLSTGPSREASRETSPSRYSLNLLDRSFGSKLRGRSGHIGNVSDRQGQSRPVMAQKILQQSREAESALADALTFDSVDGNEVGSRVPLSRKAYRSFDDHSDDSETSSVCSERSLDCYRRSGENISDIINNCASTHWNERKDGLVSLQAYFQNENRLRRVELQRVTEIFTKMFMDSHTKVFSMFLDTLNELILAHKDDLHDWIYILLTRLMNKLGGDLLGSIQNKIHKSLSIVRESFPLELQMNAIIRFLVDQTQTPNSKVKVAVLQYLAQLASYMDASSFNPGAREAAAALAKVISWTNDQKSAEIRKAAQNALIALFNLNTPQVTMILSSLSPDYQETAASLVNSHVRRSSTGSSPPSPSPHVQSPATPQSRPSLEMDEGSLNPEEVYRSLHRTTTEIQNYSFDGGLSSVKMLDKERETTSHDSGISQMSCGMEKLEEQMEHLLSISREPTNLDGQDSDQDYKNMPSAALVEENCQIVQNVIDTLKVDDDGNAKVSEQDCKKALSQLKHLIKSGAVGIIVYNFKVLLRVLVSQLALPHSPVKTYILNVLHDMIKDPTVRHCFNMYVELIVLRTLTAYSDPCKEVSKAAEHCISAIGKSLPPEQLINVVCPLIKTGDLPMNLGAIKILTRVIEHTTQDILEPHLKEIMESLIKAYDNEESSVRKSAVFCMVELHGIVGEAVLQPHLASLNNSKLKLLHLYIKRSHHGGSSGITSPKTTTS